MLIQMLFQQPQMLMPILRNTPTWVWALLAALIALGLSQVRDRNASLARIAITPVVMTGLSIYGTVSAFGGSPQFGSVMLAWSAMAAASLAAVAPFAPPSGTRYDPAARSFTLPGSWIPMLLILGVFLTKYVVGVELAMQPALAHNGPYTLGIGMSYGIFSGLFIGRTMRLWRLASRPSASRRSQAINA